MRLQALVDPQDRLPDAMEMTTVTANDAAMLGGWDLSGLRGRTLVFDLGYYSHRNLRRLVEGGVHFLTRLKAQAHHEVVANREPPQTPEKTPQGDRVLSDEMIVLGSPNNRRGDVLEGVRLVTGKNEKGEVHRFVTDRHRPLGLGDPLALPQALADRALLPVAQASARGVAALRAELGGGVADDGGFGHSGGGGGGSRGGGSSQGDDEGVVAWGLERGPLQETTLQRLMRQHWG